MNFHLEPQGFLGTGASLLADISLLAYILLLLPSMLLGLFYALRVMHRPHHKWLMIFVTVVNWFLILFLMVFSYRFDVAGSIGAQSSNTRYLIPTIHALLGIPAQLLATFIVVRMLIEDYQLGKARERGETDLEKYWFTHARITMWIVQILWLLTALFGITTYVIRYDIVPATHIGGDAAVPIATEEVLATEAVQPAATEAMEENPAATEDAPAITEEPDEAATPEPVATDDADEPEAVSTEEVVPVTTEEAGG